MAIDADLNAGLIHEDEARRRRLEISREADFYGAMDGASKFVRGDAIAGIMIVIVNVIGGIIIGTLQKGMDVATAAEVFTLLTIGDGLVTQVPALIVSTAAGIIVTRTASGTNLGGEFTKQLLMQPGSHRRGRPGFHGAHSCLFQIRFYYGRGLRRFHINSIQRARRKRSNSKVGRRNPAKRRKTRNLLPVDLVDRYGLINIIVEQKGDLLERISNIRKQFALDLGIIVPPLRIRDNLELKPGDYQILLKGISIGGGSLLVGHFLAMDPGNVMDRIPGVATKEPAFGLDATWITPKQKESATIAGYTVVDLSTVIATHLTELVRQHAHELFGRQELQTLLDAFKIHSPKILDDLIRSPVSVRLESLEGPAQRASVDPGFEDHLETLPRAPSEQGSGNPHQQVRAGLRGH